MAPQFRIAQAIGNYIISGVLGEGAMGEVYLAEHPRIGRRVAIKVLASHLAHVPGFRERFMAEAQALCRIKHPNVIDVYDFGQTPEGQLYYLMDYLEGRVLADVIEERGPMPASEVVSYGLQLCAGLQAAHDVGIVHRDLKPENVFVLGEAPPKLKILDFGIAKLMDKPEGPAATATGVLMGSPATIAPEQAMGRPDLVGTHSDIYAVGAILYWLLAGRPPFAGEAPAVIIAKHITDAPPSLSVVAPHVPAPVARIVEQCLAKRPEDRPSSAERLGVSLTRALRRSIPAPLRARAARGAAVKRLTDDLQELFQRSTRPASDPGLPRGVASSTAGRPDVLVAASGAESPEPPKSANTTTLRGATGEMVPASSSWDRALAPRRRPLLPWLGLTALLGAGGLVTWRLNQAPLPRPDWTPSVASPRSASEPPREDKTVAPTLPNALTAPPVTSAADPLPAATVPTPQVSAPAPRARPTRPKRERGRANPTVRASPTSRRIREHRGSVATQQARDEPEAEVATEPQPATGMPERSLPQAPVTTAPQARDSSPSPYQRLYLRAMERFTAGDRAEALVLARQAQRADPAQPGAPKLLGILHLERDEYALSAIHLERYLKLSPRAADAQSIRRMLSWVRRTR